MPGNQGGFGRPVEVDVGERQIVDDDAAIERERCRDAGVAEPRKHPVAGMVDVDPLGGCASVDVRCAQLDGAGVARVRGQGPRPAPGLHEDGAQRRSAGAEDEPLDVDALSGQIIPDPATGLVIAYATDEGDRDAETCERNRSGRCHATAGEPAGRSRYALIGPGQPIHRHDRVEGRDADADDAWRGHDAAPGPSAARRRSPSSASMCGADGASAGPAVSAGWSAGSSAFAAMIRAYA
jgi:hypothetical protein